MRKILLLIALCFCFVANAQSIMRIPLGSSKAEVTNQLRSRGYYVKDEAHELVVCDIKFGGIYYNIASFGFEYADNRYLFSSAKFEIRFEKDEVDTAGDNLKLVLDMYYKKYADEYYEFSYDDNYTYYKFGINPNDDKSCRVLVSYGKGKGYDEISRYYLTVWYTPANFTNNEDEI